MVICEEVTFAKCVVPMRGTGTHATLVCSIHVEAELWGGNTGGGVRSRVEAELLGGNTGGGQEAGLRLSCGEGTPGGGE